MIHIQMRTTHTHSTNVTVQRVFFFCVIVHDFLVRFWREYAHTRKEEEVERKSMISERDEMSM